MKTIRYAIRNFTTNEWIGGRDGTWGAHTTLYSAKAPATSEINNRKGLQKYKPWNITTDDLRVVEVVIEEPDV